MQKEVQFHHISRLVKIFDAHGTCGDCRVTGFWLFGSPIIKELSAHVINNFARDIQLGLHLNGEHLVHKIYECL